MRDVLLKRQGLVEGEAAECGEEALIELAEERGQSIPRRLDADPRAVLGIALVKPKPPKLERIKAA